jgi:HAD superfamily hydrolase (TIGR01509 family)
MAKAIIFDIDGTLIDSVDLHAESWQRAFARFGFELPLDEIRAQIGKGGDQLMPVFLSREELEAKGEAIEGYRSDLHKREYLPRTRAFPAVRDLFLRLREAGHQVVLASSGKRDEVERYKEIAGVADLVDDTTTSDEAERSKPHPDIFEAALAKIAPLGPGDAIVVGDTPYDAEAAAKAGLRTVGVLCGGFPRADLEGAGCVAVYEGPEDLLRRYEGSPLAG